MNLKQLFFALLINMQQSAPSTCQPVIVNNNNVYYGPVYAAEYIYAPGTRNPLEYIPAHSTSVANQYSLTAPPTSQAIGAVSVSISDGRR